MTTTTMTEAKNEAKKEVRLYINPFKVKVNERQREIVEDIDKLAESLARWGQFHPIRLETDGETLNMGFRRLTAAMSLGWDKIWYTVHGEGLTQEELIELEVEENVQRQQMTWDEIQKAIARVHDIRKKKDPNWTLEKTAEVMNVSKVTVHNAVQIVKAAEQDPTVLESEGVVSALNKIKTKRKLEEKRVEIEQRAQGLIPTHKVEILVGDALDLIKKEPSESFDAIVTNCPFGVELEYKSGHVPYYDDETYITELIQKMCPEWYRTLKNDSWFVGFFDILKITRSPWVDALIAEVTTLIENLPYEMREAQKDAISGILGYAAKSVGLTGWLEAAGFSYVTILPSIWYKPNKTQGRLGNPNRGFVVGYEAFVFAAKGDPLLLRQGLPNVWVYDTPTPSERVHSVQMPDEIFLDIYRTITISGGRLHDSFAGSGAGGRAAIEHQCDWVGFELDPEKAKNGNMRIKEKLLGTNAELDLTDVLMRNAARPS